MRNRLFLELFEKVGDRFVKDFEITHYDLKLINEICPPETPMDYEYCDGHFVEEEEFIKLQKLIKELSTFNYSEYDYNLCARRVWRDEIK